MKPAKSIYPEHHAEIDDWVTKALELSKHEQRDVKIHWPGQLDDRIQLITPETTYDQAKRWHEPIKVSQSSLSKDWD